MKEGAEAGELEGDEAFLRSSRGLLRFYGAVLQYHDLPAAWHYVACFGNTMPANVFTGTALVAFLETAGYTLHQRFRRQFVKLLEARSLPMTCPCRRPRARSCHFRSIDRHKTIAMGLPCHLV